MNNPLFERIVYGVIILLALAAFLLLALSSSVFLDTTSVYGKF